MGGFHGGHGHSGGGFHGGSHGSFHSSGCHFSSSRHTGSGGHYHGGSGGSGSPEGSLIFSILGIFVFTAMYFAFDYDFEFLIYVFTCVIVAFVSIVRLAVEHETIVNALKSDEKVENVPTKVYEVTRVDTKKNRVRTKACRIIGYVLVSLGALFIVLFHTNSTSAKIVSTKISFDGKYEEYVFEYTVDGITYYGQGDDDFVYDYSKNEYVFDIKEGEEYPIYYYMVNPSSYSFSKEPQAPLYIIFIIGGSILIIIGIVLRKKYLKSIEYVGDLNSDGKINEEDLIIYNRKKAEEELARRNEEAKKYILCPFCEAKVSKEEKNCPYCGGTLNE